MQAQIASLRAELVAAGSDVRQATLTYSQAVAEEQSLAAQVASDKVLVAQAAASVATTEAVLRAALVSAYVGGYLISPVVPASPGGVGVADPAVTEGYISVATDTVRAVIERFRAANLDWTAAEAAVSGREKASQASVLAAGRARQAALSEAAAVTAQIQGLQSQLTSLENQSGALSGGGKAPQGGPVGGGLLAVVQSQLGVATPAAGSTSVAPSRAGTDPSNTTAPASAAPPAVTLPAATVPVPVEASPAPTTLAPTTLAPTTLAPTTLAPTTLAPTTLAAGTATPAATTTPIASTSAGAAPTAADWLALRTCESGDNYQENTGNGYFGAYQFSQATWTGLGYPGRPDQEPPAMQDQAAATLQADSGWGAWPTCSAALGL